MPYVQRDAELNVVGKFARRQPGVAEEWLDDGHPDLEPSTETIAASVRATRDNLLKESDWTQMPDSPLTDAKKLEWAGWRQELRDITEQAGFPDDFVWPVRPA